MNLRRRVESWLGRPVDIASIVLMRVSFGLLMLWEVTRYFNHDWIEEYWIEPQFHFHYFGFDWVRVWPGDGMYWHFVGIGVLAFLVTVGLFYRFASVLLFLAFSYVFLLEQARYLNHFYLVCLVSFLMAVIPAHGAGSLDVRLGLYRRRDTVPNWCLALLRFQMGVVYFFGGIAKINGDWLAGEPLRTWLRARGDYPLIGPLFENEGVVMSMVYGGLLFDLLIVPLLLWRPTRGIGFLGVLFFNLMNAMLFNIGIFPWFAIAMSTLYFASDWPRRFFVFKAVECDGARKPVSQVRSHVVMAFCCVYVGWQLFLPTRHWLYPGQVSWTEEGHLYAWHMKLRSKSGRVKFFVKNEDNGQETTVNIPDFMETWQARRMATKPDMIIQFAHSLGDKLAREGMTNLSIRCEARVSLNGRKSQFLIDPEVNLLTKERSWKAKDWVLPLLQPLPRK
jgi:vitamin K-dependent gamma-carboxylase